jgi:hypothetical protein
MGSNSRGWRLAKHEQEEETTVAETMADQGTVWWPAGLGAQEKVRIVFNISLQERPVRVTCQDFDTREPMETEVVAIERSGTRDWARYTAATVRFLRPDQRGRSFRWRVHTET